MRTERLVRLDPEFGSRYPEIPAGEWLPAVMAAAWQADRLWLESGPEALRQRRVLPDQHFQFRGGTPRKSGWYITPERLIDRTPSDLENGPDDSSL